MEEEARPVPPAVVEDLLRIARRLMTLSEEVVGKGLKHTEGVDCLIGCVDRVDYCCALLEERMGEASGTGKGEAVAARAEPGEPAPGDLEKLCQELRKRAAGLDKVTREMVGAASEVGELAAELTRLEGELRRLQAPVNEAPAA